MIEILYGYLFIGLMCSVGTLLGVSDMEEWKRERRKVAFSLVLLLFVTLFWPALFVYRWLS